MTTGQTIAPSCQSCGMPMEKPEDFGTGAEGFRNNDYCHLCGLPSRIYREQMIDKIAGMAPMMKMTETQARELAKMFIPRLKRWR
ncbi:MAG: zinc ribbon domain-containing protein [Deltaproteobacteria bacterium]